MKNLFFVDSPWDRPNATLLDEAKLAFEKGDEVIIIGCDADFSVCPSNPIGSSFSCMICKKYQKEDLNLLPERVKHYNLKDFITTPIKQRIRNTQFEYNNVEDIKNLTFQGVDIGYACFSTYIDFTRNLNPLVDKHFKKYFNKLLRSSLITLLGMEQAIEQLNPDHISLRNGRFHTSRPLLRLAQQNDIPFSALELIIKGENDVRKTIFNNSLPHGISYNDSKIRELWDNSDLTENEKISKASIFYNKRIKGEVAGDVNVYTSRMISGSLPPEWNKEKTNISIYISSEDEFYALGGEWAEGIYPSQISGIKQILESFKNDKKYHFYLRIHPNLIEVKYKYHLDYYGFENQYDNFTIIPGDSDVNTYDLIKISDKIISFGSTVGAEANFLGTPSILLGNCYYKHIDLAYVPKSHEEATLLIRENIEPKPKTGAYKYGFYILREGMPYTYFNPNFKIKKANLLGVKFSYKENFREENKSMLKSIWRYSERFRIFGLPYYIPLRLGIKLIPNKEA